MKISSLDKVTVVRLREKFDELIAEFVSTNNIEGVTVSLGNCSYDDSKATYQLEVKADGVETREQKALKMYAQLDGLDLEKEHPRYKLVEFHAKKRQYPYIYIDKTKPNVRFKASVDWAIRHFGKSGSWQKEMNNG